MSQHVLVQVQRELLGLKQCRVYNFLMILVEFRLLSCYLLDLFHFSIVYRPWVTLTNDALVVKELSNRMENEKVVVSRVIEALQLVFNVFSIFFVLRIVKLYFLGTQSKTGGCDQRSSFFDLALHEKLKKLNSSSQIFICFSFDIFNYILVDDRISLDSKLGRQLLFLPQNFI